MHVRIYVVVVFGPYTYMRGRCFLDCRKPPHVRMHVEIVSWTVKMPSLYIYAFIIQLYKYGVTINMPPEKAGPKEPT